MMNNSAAGHLSHDAENRRRSHRLLCADLITVHWATGRGTARREFAVLEDYSAAGASLSIEARIEPATAVTIGVAGDSFRAVVRRCESREHGYLVGVEFDEPDRTQHAFIPDHLVDPRELGL